MTAIWLKKKREASQRAASRNYFLTSSILGGVTSKAERLRHLVLFFFQFSLSCLLYQRCDDFLRGDSKFTAKTHYVESQFFIHKVHFDKSYFGDLISVKFGPPYFAEMKTP